MNDDERRAFQRIKLVLRSESIEPLMISSIFRIGGMPSARSGAVSIV